MMALIAARLRQFAYPAEFRIGAPAIPAEWHESIAGLEAAIRAQAVPPTAGERDPAGERERNGMLCDMANSVWRLKSRMLEPGGDQPKEQFRREYSNVETLIDVLADAGVEIQDHQGDAFVEGHALKELGRVTAQGIDRPRVQETIKPTIYIGGARVQAGEVIVEVPEAPAA